MMPGSTKEKPRRTQADVGKTDEFPLLSNPFEILSGERSRDLSKCAQGPTPTALMLQMLQRPSKKVGTSRCTTGL